MLGNKHSSLRTEALNPREGVKQSLLHEGGKALAWILGMLVCISSCTPSQLSKEELTTYLQDEDHGLTKVREYKGFKTSVIYRPTDLLVLQENGDDLAIERQTHDELHAKYNPYYYFILSLSKHDKEALYGAGDQGQFSDLVQTLSFRMGQHVHLTTSARDTIPVADYVFPRTYGMGTSTNLMFVFNKEDAHGDEWIQFNLSEFGMGLGRQNFRFRVEDLESVPRLKFDFIKETSK